MSTFDRLIPLLLLAGCTASAPPPPPAPAAPPPRPAPVVTPLVDWRDAPLTPGGWSYLADAGTPSARFGDGLVVLRCDRTQRVLTLAGSGIGGNVAISTSYGDFSYATPMAANDKHLDEMAFSRGRIALASPGMARLVLPAWPELGRVIEDCRG